MIRCGSRCEAPFRPRGIGWRAYAHGGLDLMHRVSDLAQDAGASGAIIDKWWDRIGGPNGTWWC